MAPDTAYAFGAGSLADSAVATLQIGTGGFLELALVFFVLAIVAALVGASGVAGISMEIARIFVLVFVVLAIASLLL